MSTLSDSDATVTGRICALERMIDTSLMELTEVEVVINAKCQLSPVERDGLQSKRLILTNAIVKMDAELKQLRSNPKMAEACHITLRHQLTEDPEGWHGSTVGSG